MDISRRVLLVGGGAAAVVAGLTTAGLFIGGAPQGTTPGGSAPQAGAPNGGPPGAANGGGGIAAGGGAPSSQAAGPPADAPPAPSDGGDPRLGPRGLGQAGAPVVVTEFFSLTCGHCASFHNTVWPQVKRELVDTGRVRMVWRDFPLDSIALLAAALARTLPGDRYDAFITTLFQTQDRWAFAQGRQVEELARIAALAGIDREAFNAVANDQDFLRGLLQQRLEAEQRWQIRATPSFLFNSRLHTGGLSFAEFERQVRTAPQT